MTTNDFAYEVQYSGEDNAYIAYLKNMPSLSVYANTKQQAIKELKNLVEYCSSDAECS